MIQETCLVGCREELHHKFCSNRFETNNLHYSEPDINNDYSIDLQIQLLKIINKYGFNLRYASDSSKKRKMFFVNHLHSILKYSEKTIAILLETDPASIRILIKRHVELCQKEQYILMCINLKIDLSKLNIKE